MYGTRKTRLAAAALALSALTGCLQDPPAFDVSGGWSGVAASGDTVRVSLTRVPRSSQDFYDVTGTGTYAAASGHHGVIVVSGTVSRGGALNPGVFLDAQLSYDSLPTDAFYGKVSGDTALIGTLSEAHVEYAAHRALTLVRVPASHAPGIGSATLHN